MIMSVSEHLTAAYTSKESSIQTLSTTLVEGAANGAKAPTNTDRRMNALPDIVAGGRTTQPPSRAKSAVPASLMANRASEEEQFMGTDLPAPSGGRHRTSLVVNRGDMSIADISQMRLEGCRTRRLSPGSSCCGSVGEGTPSSMPPAPMRRCVSNASSPQVDRQDAVSSTLAAAAGMERSVRRRSTGLSTGANALDTSVAILQHMAYDTAARVEATHGGQTPTELLAVSEGANDSAPLSVATVQRQVVPETPLPEGDGREDATGPIGMFSTSDTAHSLSQMRTGGTRPYSPSSASSNSPLHSLSESELCGAHVHPLGASRNVSAQALSQLADQAVDVPDAAGRGGSDCGVPPGAARFGDSPDGARRRLRLVGAAAAAHGGEGSGSEVARAAAAAAPFCSPPVLADEVPRTIDATVYNHDFQRIISLEVKEALTRNMRPSVDDDEDEDEAMLDYVLSGKVSPALLPVPTRGSVQMNDSRFCAFAPFQLPMAATSVGRLDSIVGSPGIDSNTKAASGFSSRPAARQPLSLSTAALEGDALACSDATTTTSSRGSKGRNPRTVSAQAWRFPALGYDSPVISPAARRASQEENEVDAEERDSAAAATNTTGNEAQAAGSSRHTQRTAQPASCNSSSDHPPGQPTPLSNSWRHRRGSDTSSAAHARSRPASGNDPVLGGPAGHDSTAPSGTGAHESSGRHAETTTTQQSAGVASMVRYEDGRRFTQPQVSTHSSSSLPGSGQVLEDSYPRKLEMMHTVYERLVQHRRNAPTPKAVKALVARKVSQGALDNFPTTPQTVQFAQGRSSGSAVAVAAGTAPSSAVSSHARRSLSLSCSGALGRSAGYYSFGTRVSLSHPNRQALPQQYLGSCSNLMHGNPSPGATMLGSPAVSSLVAASANGCNASGVPAAAPLNPSALEGFFTPATSPAARVARRSLNSVLLRRIESRPLLQSTLFLKHTLHAIREEHGDLPYPSDTSKGSITMSQLALSGATAVPSGQRDASTANPATCVSGSDFLASAANPASEDADLSSHNTRGPSAGSSRSSVIDKAAAGNRKGDASGGMASEAAQVHVDPTVLDNTAHAAERSAPQLQHEQPSTGAAAQVYTPSRTEDAGTTAQRYYRALTEAEQRVRHVHGVDGLEREVDNESMDLIVYVGMRLMGWLEVVSLLGCGSFGQVFLCKDLRICDGHFVHPSELGGEDYEYWNCSHAFLPFSSVDIAPTNPPLVAVKVVKSVPLLEQQSVLEAEMLVLIGAQTAPAAASATSECSTGAPPPEDPRCASVAKVLADGICYGHHCIIMERYGANLYEYIASNEHLGLPMYQIRSIGAQLFTALSLIHEECHIIHADIKPENMLLALNSSRGVVRTNEAAAAATATTTTTAPDAVAVLATAPATTTTRSPAARDSVSDAMPPRRLPRCEDSMMTTCSPERSYITLRAGPTAAGRHRHGQLSRRSSAVPLEASTSMMGRSRGQSFFHLRSSATSRMTVVEQTAVPAPEPRRVQSLNQSAGMLSSRHPSTSPPDASRAAADGAAGPNASALTTNVSGKAAATAVVSPPSMIPRLHVKLIDFSSSCYDGGPFYQYIQSRYYRAPEVVVGATYGSGIDMWSSGCLLAELLLGMPLLPGCNDHHQLCLIEEMVGPLPAPMLEEGVNMELYYRHVHPENVGAAAAATTPTPSTQPAAAAATAPPTPPPRPFALRTREEFLEITQSEPQPYRRYFTYQTLQELVRHCPLTLEERRMSNGLQPYVPANESSEIPPDATPSPSVRSEMMKQRFLLFDLLRRLLQTDATQRPTASQALAHPFFTSAPPYMKTFKLD